MAAGKKWYALYTVPRAEKQVEQRLKRAEVETYLPLHLSPRQWSDRIKLVEVPLLPSYIFVKTTEPLLRSGIIPTHGVVRSVYYNGKPAVIRDPEIAAIRLFLEKARAKEIAYSLDEKVLIACGPLKNIAGKVKRIGKTHIALYLEQLGVMVSVAINQVKKLPGNAAPPA
ncbi:MAG: UpxY family transcription antiterminator [Prevotellaceae bacterium]|nr:UpxY family transcription antiterminator [Prevotellaceae bacterium]